MIYNFYMPSTSYLGINSIKELATEINNRDFTKALIVTDSILVKIGLINSITNVLESNNTEYVIYSETKQNPTIENVDAGLKLLKDNNCDFIISFGGGSPHDAAKGMALLATNGGKISDYEGVNLSKKPQLPLISINTTAGTASEMTRFCIITDEKRHIKMAIVDKNVTPIISVNDPILMTNMPQSLTAATGMDALTHAIEAFTSTIANPITDACAEKAIEIIRENLRIAVEEGENIDAREKMAFAEYLAGMAFNNASLGYVHAMAHQLGGMYNLPHGVCNAILLPHVLKYNSSHISFDKMKKIAILMGVDPHSITKENVSEKAINEIISLSKEINIPNGLEILGAKEEDFFILAENAMKDACGLTNPKVPSHQDVIDIYKSAF